MTKVLANPEEFIVEVRDEPRKVTIRFAAMSDLSFVETWRESLGTNPEPIQRDAVDLAQLARDRYLADSRVGQPYIATLPDVHQYLAKNSQGEIAGLMLLKADWFAQSPILGICHFRRTWCNNIVLDYLAKHPLTLAHLDDSHRIKGIGPAMLCLLSRIAIEHSCEHIWGEATQSSCAFYKKLFSLDDVRDLFVIPRKNFTSCANLSLDWQGTNEVNTINMRAVEDLYDVEESSPPLVGNRTLMLGSNRQLIHHFLDLARHTQDEIAQALSLFQDGDSNILEDEWCGILFQRARQAGKLPDLWTEVESRHQFGEPEKNPFLH